MSRPPGIQRLVSQRIWNPALGAVLACLTALLLVLAFHSLHSRIAHDSPIMFYLALLFDRFGLVPYRDTFDMNLPGSYLCYVLLGKVSGYTDFGIRVTDLCLLLLLSVFTGLMLRRLGQWTAWMAAILFPLAYLLKGNEVSLQREFLILVFLSAALMLLFNGWPFPPLLRAGLIGGLLGVCVTIKPQMALVWPLLALYGAEELAVAGRRERRGLWLASLFGFLLPPVAALGYLVSVHALHAFVDVARNYWPLYGALNGENHALYGAARARYILVNTVRLETNARWVLPALLGLWVAWTQGDLSSEARRQVKLLALLALFFCVYPAFSGQFWAYHGLPLLYFALTLTSLCLVPLLPSTVPVRLRWLVPGRVAVPLLLLLLFGHWVKKYQPDLHPKGGRPAQIAAFLSAHLRPGDRVQPLDWTGGAVQAMLTTRARIATPFIYDFYFYHHVSHPYIQGLRRRLMADLSAAPPRFIVEVTSDDKPWPSGRDTTRQFPELRRFLAERYQVAERQNGYVIWERRDGSG